MCKGGTMIHVFSNSPKYLDRYKWHHDSILKLVDNKIERSNTDTSIELYVNCEKTNYRCTSDKVFAIELAASFETNTEKSRRYKQDRYKSLRDQLLVACEEFELISLNLPR